MLRPMDSTFVMSHSLTSPQNRGFGNVLDDPDKISLVGRTLGHCVEGSSTNILDDPDMSSLIGRTLGHCFEPPPQYPTYRHLR